MESNKKSISTTLFISFLVVIFFSLVIQTALWVTNIYQISSIQRAQSEQQYIQSHKSVIKHEVEHLVETISSIQKKTELHLKAEIKKRVNTAHAIALNIYNKNSGKRDHDAIQEMITDAIIPLLTTDTQQLFIIGNISGEILFSKKQAPFSSSSSTAISSFKELSDVILSKGEGYSSWKIQDTPSDAKQNNIVFVKLFKPMNLIIGTGFYLEEMTTKAKKTALEQINTIRYGNNGEGYLFAFQYDGLYLSHPVPQYVGQNLIDITDPNGVKINREIVKECQSGGGFTSYVWDRYKTGKLIDKISYVKGYEGWNWAIGTGFYLDDLQQEINIQKDILEDEIKSFFLKISIFSIMIFIISGIIIKLIVGKLNAELAIFHDFFDKSVASSEEISLEEVKFLEFQQLAKKANKMLMDRLSMESALVQSEKRFRNLVDDLPKIAVQGYDNDRNVIYWNHASEILYGYNSEEAMGEKLEDLIVPAAMKDHVISAICNWYDHDVVIPSSELILRHKDGSDVPVYSSHVMLSGREGGKETYCIDLGLADLKAAQEKEQESESFYRQLFDHSSSGVAVYEAVDNGQDFIFKDFNKAGEEIDNIKRGTLLGRRVLDVFPGIEEFGLLDVFRQVWQTGVPALHPVSCYKDGMLQGWRENRVYKLPSGEIVAVYDDITKQKQLEVEKKTVEIRLHQAQKMEAIGLMAGGVAHDLNNILTGITGYPELLLLKLSEKSDLRQPIEAIKESGERAAAIVADLLTVARGVASTRVTANLNTLVTEYLESPEWRQLHSQNKHIQCDTILAENLPGISCSPVHIKKCILNLVTNAVEALGKSGDITLSTTAVIPDLQFAKDHELNQKEYVILAVADTGSGISTEDIEHIFEPFYTKKMMGISGTGLGLAVVWNTMEDHDGKIFVESSRQGTCFHLYFPVQEGGDVRQAENNTKEQLTGNDEHILVVDDEPQLRDIASQMLQILGYKVDSVCSGELAIKFLKENPVDLIVMDMLMEPGMSGYLTYKELLKLYPDQRAVIASGFSESDDVKAALRLGASGFIQKPYSIDRLGQVVKKALQS